MGTVLQRLYSDVMVGLGKLQVKDVGRYAKSMLRLGPATWYILHLQLPKPDQNMKIQPLQDSAHFDVRGDSQHHSLLTHPNRTVVHGWREFTAMQAVLLGECNERDGGHVVLTEEYGLRDV